MTLHLYQDPSLNEPLSEGDFTNPDQDSFNGTEGESKDRALYLANEHTLLSTAMDAAQTNLSLAKPLFADTQIIVIDAEQMEIVAGQGSASLTVNRGYGGTTSVAHEADAVVRSGYDYDGVTVTPVDESGTDESHWLTLAPTQAALDTADPGEPLVLGAKPHDQTLVFWRRVTVPPETPVQNKTDVKLRVSALESPIV